MTQTPDDLRAIRKKLGLSLLQMGQAIGYQGTDQTIKNVWHRYETGERECPPWIARLAYMLGRYGVPPQFK